MNAKTRMLSGAALLSGLLLILAAGAGFEHERIEAAPNEPRVVFLQLTSGYWQVWLMDGDGQPPRQLTSSPVDKHSPAWCPGNEVIHFSTARGDNVPLNLDTGEEHPQLPPMRGVEPPKDADGNPLVFESNFEGAKQIYRVRSNGQGIERLTGGKAPARSPVCSWCQTGEPKP